MSIKDKAPASLTSPRRVELDGAEVLLIDIEASDLVAIMTERGWQFLQRMKLNRLLISNGRVCATAKGYAGRPQVARLLTGTCYGSTLEAVHRNGNLLDLRESNLLVAPRSLVLGARKARRTPQPRTTISVKCGDGKIRARHIGSTAPERLAAALATGTIPTRKVKLLNGMTTTLAAAKAAGLMSAVVEINNGDRPNNNNKKGNTP